MTSALIQERKGRVLLTPGPTQPGPALRTLKEHHSSYVGLYIGKLRPREGLKLAETGRMDLGTRSLIHSF